MNATDVDPEYTSRVLLSTLKAPLWNYVEKNPSHELVQFTFLSGRLINALEVDEPFVSTTKHRIQELDPNDLINIEDNFKLVRLTLVLRRDWVESFDDKHLTSSQKREFAAGGSMMWTVFVIDSDLKVYAHTSGQVFSIDEYIEVLRTLKEAAPTSIRSNIQEHIDFLNQAKIVDN